METCKQDGCERTDLKKNGLCMKHDQRRRLDARPPCTVKGCEKKQHARKLCAMHYDRFRKGMSIGAVERELTPAEVDRMLSKRVLAEILGYK